MHAKHADGVRHERWATLKPSACFACIVLLICAKFFLRGAGGGSLQKC